LAAPHLEKADLMSDDEKQEMVTLRFTWTDHAPKKLAARIEDLKRSEEYERSSGKLDDVTAAIHSLRGTAARASFVLPALYLALGAGSLPKDPARTHWQAVQAAVLEPSALHTIALTCRGVFNDSKTDDLSGRRIARLSDEALASVAKYWSGHSKRSEEEATQALEVLRRLFIRCARPKDVLLDQSSLLERRIGLLKYYANRQAAHITLDYYLFDILDVIHVAAAIVLIGAIIVDFDSPWQGERYFDSVDEGGWQAAKVVFPHLPIERIFKDWNIHRQAVVIWRESYRDGVQYILDQLPAAIGYWDDRPESE
jgi:hypothetical protein